MAEEENVAELRDIASELKAAFEAAANSADKMNRSFQSSKRELLNLDEVFRELLHVSDEFPGNITKASQLQKAIVEDGRLFVKTQEASLRLFKQIAKDGWEAQVKHMQEASGLSLDQLVNTKEYEAELQKHNKLTEKNTSLLNRNFEILKKQALARKMDSLVLGNITDAIDDLGAKVRSPNLAFASMLKKVGSLPGGIFNAAKNSKNLGETLIKFVGPSLSKIGSFAKVLFSPTGLLVAGAAGAAAALTVVYKLLANFAKFLDSKAIPAAAAFNREIGSTSENAQSLRKEFVSTGFQFQYLGKSFQEGVAFMKDFTLGLTRTTDATKEAIELGKELTLVVGLTAQESSKLIATFQREGKSLDDLREMFGVAEAAARNYNLPVNEVLRDLGKFPNILARFGVKHRTEFAKSVAQARDYGLEIGKISDAFGEQLDTFEGSSEVASNLNAIFGTSINSFDLMLQHDPIKRMEMIRGALVGVGKAWDDLSVSEQNVIASTLNKDKDFLQTALASDEVRKKLEAERKQKQKNIDVDKKWKKELGQITETLIPWEALLDNLMRKMTEFLGRMMGTKGVAATMTELARRIESAFFKIGEVIDKIDEKSKSVFWRGIMQGGDFASAKADIGDEQVDKILSSHPGAKYAGDTGFPFYDPILTVPDAASAMDLIPISPTVNEIKPTKPSESNNFDFSRPDLKKEMENVNFNFKLYIDGKELKASVVESSRP